MTRCYCCGSSAPFLREVKADEGQVQSLHQCPECGHGFVSPLTAYDMSQAFKDYNPAPPSVPTEYAAYDLRWGRNLANLFALQMFSEITESSVILEIGPGADGIFAEMKRAGHDGRFYAYEPCRHYRAALEALGVHVFPTAFDSNTAGMYLQTARRKADIIVTANQAYFHHDPVELLRSLGDLLAPGGLLLLLVQNSSSQLAHITKTNGVMHWFSPASFQFFLQRIGLDVLFAAPCGPPRSSVDAGTGEAHAPGRMHLAGLRRLIERGVNAMNRLSGLPPGVPGPLLFLPGFSPAVAIARHQEFQYGRPDRYQLKALLRAPA